MLGDHHLWRKTYAYDPSARVPLIVAPPSAMKRERNTEQKAMVGWEDIMPSLLEAAGVPIPDTVEGTSFLPLLAGDDFDWRTHYHHAHAPCYAPTNAYESLTSVEWKYVWNPITGEEQLFHRTEDPFELHDLAQDAKTAELLGEWRLELAKRLVGRPENLSDGERLQTGKVPVWRDPRGERD